MSLKTKILYDQNPDFFGQDESDNGGEGPHMHSLNWNIDRVVEQ